MGREALELGGNAVIGYRQCFDLENKEYSITARAIGTCVRLESKEQASSTAGAFTSPLGSDERIFDRGLGETNPNFSQSIAVDIGGASALTEIPDTLAKTTNNGGMVDAVGEPSAATDRFAGPFMPLTLARNNSTIGNR